MDILVDRVETDSTAASSDMSETCTFALRTLGIFKEGIKKDM